MPTSNARDKAAEKTTVPPAPPYYIARVPLHVGGDAGTMPVRAFSPGDHVPPDLVAPNGWSDDVDVPEEFTTPPADTPPPADSTTKDAGGDAAEKRM